jgi:hypothetical protein
MGWLELSAGWNAALGQQRQRQQHSSWVKLDIQGSLDGMVMGWLELSACSNERQQQQQQQQRHNGLMKL